MSEKPTEIERINRVRIVEEMIVKGCGRNYILQFCSENFDVGDRCSDNYIKEAKKRILSDFKKSDDKRDMKAEMMARFQDLYRKNYTIQDFRECRNIISDIRKMFGLDEAEKFELNNINPTQTVVQVKIVPPLQDDDE